MTLPQRINQIIADQITAISFLIDLVQSSCISAWFFCRDRVTFHKSSNCSRFFDSGCKALMKTPCESYVCFARRHRLSQLIKIYFSDIPRNEDCFPLQKHISGRSVWRVKRNMTFSSVYFKTFREKQSFRKLVTFSSRANLNGNLCSILL